MSSNAQNDRLGYYATLGVAPGADDIDKVIQKAYRTQSLLLHPDKPTGSTEAFQELGDAYNVLSDKAARAAYDLSHKATAATTQLFPNGFQPKPSNPDLSERTRVPKGEKGKSKPKTKGTKADGQGNSKPKTKGTKACGGHSRNDKERHQAKKTLSEERAKRVAAEKAAREAGNFKTQEEVQERKAEKCDGERYAPGSDKWQKEKAKASECQRRWNVESRLGSQRLAELSEAKKLAHAIKYKGLSLEDAAKKMEEKIASSFESKLALEDVKRQPETMKRRPKQMCPIVEDWREESEDESPIITAEEAPQQPQPQRQHTTQLTVHVNDENNKGVAKQSICDGQLLKSSNATAAAGTLLASRLDALHTDSGNGAAAILATKESAITHHLSKEANHLHKIRRTLILAADTARARQKVAATLRSLGADEVNCARAADGRILPIFTQLRKDIKKSQKVEGFTAKTMWLLRVLMPEELEPLFPPPDDTVYPPEPVPRDGAIEAQLLIKAFKRFNYRYPEEIEDDVFDYDEDSEEEQDPEKDEEEEAEKDSDKVCDNDPWAGKNPDSGSDSTAWGW